MQDTLVVSMRRHAPALCSPPSWANTRGTSGQTNILKASCAAPMQEKAQRPASSPLLDPTAQTTTPQSLCSAHATHLSFVIVPYVLKTSCPLRTGVSARHVMHTPLTVLLSDRAPAGNPAPNVAGVAGGVRPCCHCSRPLTGSHGSILWVCLQALS